MFCSKSKLHLNLFPEKKIKKFDTTILVIPFLFIFFSLEASLDKSETAKVFFFQSFTSLTMCLSLAHFPYGTKAHSQRERKYRCILKLRRERERKKERKKEIRPTLAKVCSFDSFCLSFSATAWIKRKKKPTRNEGCGKDAE